MKLSENAKLLLVLSAATENQLMKSAHGNRLRVGILNVSLLKWNMRAWKSVAALDTAYGEYRGPIGYYAEGGLSVEGPLHAGSDTSISPKTLPCKAHDATNRNPRSTNSIAVHPHLSSKLVSEFSDRLKRIREFVQSTAKYGTAGLIHGYVLAKSFQLDATRTIQIPKLTDELLWTLQPNVLLCVN